MSLLGDSSPGPVGTDRPLRWATPLASGGSIYNLLNKKAVKKWHDACIAMVAHRMSRALAKRHNAGFGAGDERMKAASVTTTLGLVLISGALLAATATPTGDAETRAKAEFERLDRNDDDRISRREAESNPGLAAHFAKFDRDSDDILVWKEFLRHEELSASGIRNTDN